MYPLRTGALLDASRGWGVTGRELVPALALTQTALLFLVGMHPLLFGFQLFDQKFETFQSLLIGYSGNQHPVACNHIVDLLALPAHRQFQNIYFGN